MQRFTSRFRARLTMFGVMAIYGGFPTFFFLLPLWTGRVHAAHSIAPALVVLLFVFSLPVLYGLLGLIEACSVYEVNDEGIVKRSARGETRLLWRNLRAYEVSSSKNVLTLTDGATRLNVVWASVVTGYRFQDKAGVTLHTVLTERLASLESQMQQRAEQGQTFAPGLMSPAGMMAFVLPGIALLMACGFGFMDFKPTPTPVQRLELCGLPLALALPLFLMGLNMLLTRITVTATHITQTSPRGTRRIPFDHITAFAVQERKGNNTTIEIVTLRGEGQTIRFTSSLPNYGLLLAFVRARLAPDVLAHVDTTLAIEKEREARSMIWQMPVVGLILAGLLTCLGFLFLSEGNSRLANYRTLDAQGRTTLGRVLDKKSGGRSSSPYSVDLAFDVNGKTYQTSAILSESDYDVARVGGSMAVVYLPSDPEIHHAAASLGRQKAVETIRVGRIILTVAGLLPVVFLILTMIWYRLKYRAPAHIRSLEESTRL